MDDKKVPRHVFRFVEAELYSYRDNKNLIRDYEDQVAEEGMIPISELVSVGETNQISDPTANKVMKLLTNREIQRISFFVRAIEGMLSNLTDEQKRLVELKYFDQNLTNQGVAAEMSISERQFYKLRIGIVYRFARRFGLVA